MSAILSGNFAHVSANLPSIKLGLNGWVVFAVGFRCSENRRDFTGSKIFVANRTNLWDRFREVDKVIRSSGLEPTTIEVFGPYIMGNAIMKALRNVLSFTKDTKHTGIEYVKWRPVDVGNMLQQCLVDGAFQSDKDTVVQAVHVPVRKVMQYRQNNRKTRKKVDTVVIAPKQPIEKTPGVESQYRHICEVTFPEATVVLEEWTKKKLIRLRIFCAAVLNSEHFMEAEGDDFHFAWKCMWHMYDIRTSRNIVREHITRKKLGYTGSILDLAEEKGLIEEVYAFVLETYYKEPMMPQIKSTAKKVASTTDIPPKPKKIIDTLINPVQRVSAELDAVQAKPLTAEPALV